MRGYAATSPRSLQGWRPDDLADVATRLPASSTARSCCAGRRTTRSSRSTSRTASPTTFPDARLVEFPDALTFVSLDQPGRLAEEIGRFAGPPS